MNYYIRLILLSLCILFVSGCAGGPMGTYDADKVSESKWKIKKKALSGGGVVKYTADLKTKGKKFVAKMSSTSRDAMTGSVSKEKYTVLSDGNYVWIKDMVSTFDGETEKSDKAYRWKVDSELLRPELFWKSNYMAGAPEDKGTEKIDGKEYKVLESVMGNAMGGSTKYTYHVDEAGGRYRRLSREFVGDNHTDVYDCTEYKSSSTATDKDFVYTGDAEDTSRFSFFQ